jgi:hypothetical protein
MLMRILLAEHGARRVPKRAPRWPRPLQHGVEARTIPDPAPWHHAPVKAARKSSSKPTKTAKPAGAGRKPAAKKPASRPDLGAPIDGFFGKQPEHLRRILEELRAMIERAAPDAGSSIKWGMPFFSVGGTMMCALSGHRSHVNLILAGPPGAFADPDGRLSGVGKTGRHLKLTSLDELPRAAVRGWLRTSAELARGKQKKSAA